MGAKIQFNNIWDCFGNLFLKYANTVDFHINAKEFLGGERY
tara:strand:- start:247 stop:369 length:123 start_codon:yes stop_codon:yes gene_type:complete